MDSFRKVDQARKHIAGVYSQGNERIEELRKILEDQAGRPVSSEEARQVGADLTTIYDVLARGRTLTKSEKKT